MYDIRYHETDLSDKSFLVTGGAGFIGSNIVEYLLKYGAKKVRVLDNLLTGNYKNVKPFEGNPAFEFMEGDITDSDTCHRACAGIDYVSHQAALGSVPRSIKDPARTNTINVGGFLNMLIAAKDSGVKMFVYASSSSVYGDETTLPKVENKIGNPLSPYAVSKYTNELYARVFHANYGLRVIGLRYFNVFGPNQDPNGPYAAVIPLFTDKIMKREVVYINGDGEQTRDFTFVENAVQANIRGMLCSNPAAINEVFNIAYGENYSVNEMYDRIAAQLGSDHRPTHRDPREGDIQNSLANIDKAKTLLGYDPQFSFGRGLEITVDYFRRM
ncbi:MAG: SDR family oxidoreductase [Bacteroidetes bacterium]|nr:SDR family oxidoreductase [Bacteroidota bacterium]MBS1686914.1 SDR family oxidoreductase [Bacteroidota bacterium]